MSRILLSLAFLGMGLTLIFGVHYYIWARLIRDTALPAPWPSIGKALLVVLYASLPASFIVTRFVSRDAARWFGWPVYTWMGMIVLLLVCLTIADSARVITMAGMRLVGAGPLDPSRRVFLGRVLGGAVAVASGGLGAFGIRNALAGLEIREVPVPMPRLHASLDGYTIAQLTDLHFGPTIGRDFAEEVVRRTNALGPDLIVITGDLVDGSVAQLRDIVAPLADLRARHGVWFVTGNHEYYAGADAWIAELRRLGIGVLRNERVSLGEGDRGFDLAGVDDWNANIPGHGPDLPRALAGRDPARPVVLLAHQPRAIHEAASLGVDLQLSGHTHGGQIWPWMLLVRLQQPYVAGLHRHGDAHIYVSRGTGYWGPPMRVGAAPEITRVVLRAGTPATQA